jgi:hypothetical protein
LRQTNEHGKEGRPLAEEEDDEGVEPEDGARMCARRKWQQHTRRDEREKEREGVLV